MLINILLNGIDIDDNDLLSAIRRETEPQLGGAATRRLFYDTSTICASPLRSCYHYDFSLSSSLVSTRLRKKRRLRLRLLSTFGGRDGQ